MCLNRSVPCTSAASAEKFTAPIHTRARRAAGALRVHRRREPMQLLTRRALAAALTASVSLLPPRPALAKYGGFAMQDVLGKTPVDDGCRSISGCASNRAAMPFTVELPDDFVTIPASGRAKSDFLLVSGNFGTGGGTTGAEESGANAKGAAAKARETPFASGLDGLGGSGVHGGHLFRRINGVPEGRGRIRGHHVPPFSARPLNGPPNPLLSASSKP